MLFHSSLFWNNQEPQIGCLLCYFLPYLLFEDNPFESWEYVPSALSGKKTSLSPSFRICSCCRAWELSLLVSWLPWAKVYIFVCVYIYVLCQWSCKDIISQEAGIDTWLQSQQIITDLSFLNLALHPKCLSERKQSYFIILAPGTARSLCMVKLSWV